MVLSSSYKKFKAGKTLNTIFQPKWEFGYIQSSLKMGTSFEQNDQPMMPRLRSATKFQGPKDVGPL